MTGEVACWLCGDPLHEVADTAADAWAWVDAAGSRFGTDADLRGLAPGYNTAAPAVPDPEGRLAWLRDEMGRAVKQCKRGAEHTWLYWAHAREYTSLKVRLETAGTFHEHRVRVADVPPFAGVVPEHCGWPMWLRPSGWHCRQGCGRWAAARFEGAGPQQYDCEPELVQDAIGRFLGLLPCRWWEEQVPPTAPGDELYLGHASLLAEPSPDGWGYRIAVVAAVAKPEGASDGQPG